MRVSGPGVAAPKASGGGAGDVVAASQPSNINGPACVENMGCTADPAQQHASCRWLPEPRLRNERGRVVAQQDLARSRGRFHRGHRGRVQADDEQFSLPAPGEYEQVPAAVHSYRYPKDNAPAGCHHRTAISQSRTHPVCRSTRSLRVQVAFEEEKECVTAELDEVPTLRCGDFQQSVECCVEDDRELLGAGPAEAGELFGKPSETRDVSQY